MLVMGAPGSGKGTISTKILKDFPFFHISSGDLLRDQSRSGTELGLKAKSFMDKGELLPDTLIVDLVMDFLESKKTQSLSLHLLLDGFPRTVQQAIALDARMTVDNVLSLNVPHHIIMERLTDRWVHPGSGRVYAYSYKPPITHGLDDVTGEKLIRRNDDKPEVVAARLEKYESTASALKDHYERRGIVTSFSGTKSNEIYKDVHLFLTKLLQ